MSAGQQRAAERAKVLTAAEMAAARAAGVAGRAVVGERAVRRAVRQLEAAAGGPLGAQCVSNETPHIHTP